MPAVTLDQRCRLIEACTRTALAAPPPPHSSSRRSARPRARARLAAARGRRCRRRRSEELAPPLVAALDMSSAALKQMRPLGGAAVAELLASCGRRGSVSLPRSPCPARGRWRRPARSSRSARWGRRRWRARRSRRCRATAERVVVGLQHTRAPGCGRRRCARRRFLRRRVGRRLLRRAPRSAGRRRAAALAPPAEERPDLCAALLRTCARAPRCARRRSCARRRRRGSCSTPAPPRDEPTHRRARRRLPPRPRPPRAYGRDPAESAALAHLLGGAGDALLGAAIRGLPDSPCSRRCRCSPTSSPRSSTSPVARPPPPGRRDRPAARRWAVAPSARCRRAGRAERRHEARAARGALRGARRVRRRRPRPRAHRALREELISFARVCRGIEAAAFNIAAYDWVPAG